tara:strand:- start:638 stop:1339 length:702 start_codon:yes stop_codon:yes gene_type:complete
MGGVFFRRDRRPRAEVLNDLSRDVSNLFRILQRHYVPFVEMMRWQLTTRAEFERLSETPAETLTDLERAARFLYLQRTSFGGKVSGRNFAVSVGQGSRFDVTQIVPRLEALHNRLAGVVIECLPYDRAIERYDGADTLFYLDPPYYGSERDYGAGMFARANFTDLAGRLESISGRFLLSINDVPEIRTLFAWATLQPVELNYSISKEQGTPAAELLISNGPIDGLPAGGLFSG